MATFKLKLHIHFKIPFNTEFDGSMALENGTNFLKGTQLHAMIAFKKEHDLDLILYKSHTNEPNGSPYFHYIVQQENKNVVIKGQFRSTLKIAPEHAQKIVASTTLMSVP